MYLVYWEKILVVVLVVVVDYTSPCGYYYQCRENIMIGMKALERNIRVCVEETRRNTSENSQLDER
jgi:hypothetical protein